MEKKNIEKFNEFYKKISKEINNYLKEYNENLVKDKKGFLKENLEYFKILNSDGKLIRGFLIALGYKMSKENIEYSYKLSLAYEIFQTAILIHDDIIDNDNLRRGKDTIHYANYKKYKSFNEIDAKKTSESIGICIGDYGFFKVNEIIIKNYKDNPNFIKLFNYYNDIVLKTVEGELIDVILSFEGKYIKENKNIEENIMLVYKLKTAFYTIIGPLSLGLILGGIDDEKLVDVKIFGEKIGVAFQIQDDILGIYSDMGKVIGSDIKEFKQTILYSYTCKNEKYREELLKYYGKEDINEVEINETRRIFKESGAYEYAYNLMNKLYNESIEIVKNNKWIKDEDKQIIVGFIEYLRTRIV
jgi:geranylgeranyl diphosphate synthase type I